MTTLNKTIQRFPHGESDARGHYGKGAFAILNTGSFSLSVFMPGLGINANDISSSNFQSEYFNMWLYMVIVLGRLPLKCMVQRYYDF